VAPSSPDLNPLDYHVWEEMLKSYHKPQPKPKTIPEFKYTLSLIWPALLEKAIDRAMYGYCGLICQPTVKILNILYNVIIHIADTNSYI